MSVKGDDSELERLGKELESVNLDLDELDKEIATAVQECSDSSSEENVVKEKNEIAQK